jgi:hypothetical protein
MRGIPHRILARTQGRRRASVVTGTATLGSAAAAVVLGMGLAGQASTSTDSIADAGSAGVAASMNPVANQTGHSASLSTGSRSVLAAPAAAPTSTSRRAQVRSGGS